jgi:hypothetical protein
MTNQNITEQLQRIVSSDDFANSSAELTEAWSSKGIGVESVDPILEFMEAFPDLHYGIPGALVHFVEEFYQKGYEERLIKSMNRKPRAYALKLTKLAVATDDFFQKSRIKGGQQSFAL